MGRLDSYLRLLVRDGVSGITDSDTSEGMVHGDPEPGEPTRDGGAEPVYAKVGVLLQFTGSLDSIKEAGFEVTSVVGDIAAGYIPQGRLKQVGELDNVVMIEAARPLMDELDESIVEIEADQVHDASPRSLGAGVIVGVIDSGINYTHQCFRTDSGSSRILAIWDQNAKPRTEEERPPKGFSQGVEYPREMIDEALKLGDKCYEKVPHQDKRRHGTMVTGVAAGNGLAAGLTSVRRPENPEEGAKMVEVDIIEKKPARTYVGVAPEADILVVAYDEGGPMGDSHALHDALVYMLRKAESLERPIVINLSQGDSIGPHDGTSCLERSIDKLMTKPGRAIVKSAGNARGKAQHASGPLGETLTLELKVPGGDTRRDIIDIWYSGSDLLDVAIRQPDGESSEVIGPDTLREELPMPNGNQVWIESTTNDPRNHDNRILMKLNRGKLDSIQEGTWGIVLTGRRLSGGGEFHAWIDSNTVDLLPEFSGKYANDSCTVSTPGTAEKIITVGTYNTRFAPDEKPDADLPGSLAPYSALGPTRDGRTKPELVAPGQSIVTPRADCSEDKQYFFMCGTSMSAPHVAGAIALLFASNRNLTQAEVKDILCRCAHPPQAPASEKDGWGAGKLKLKKAFEAL